MRKLDVYTERFLVLISKEQKQKLEKYAEKKLLKLSDVARIMIDEFIKNHASEIEDSQK